MVVSGSARIWLDGQPVLTHDLRQIRADQHLVEPDTAAFFIVPFHFAEAYANRLTSSTFDPVSKTPGFKKSAARIERLH